MWLHMSQHVQPHHHRPLPLLRLQQGHAPDGMHLKSRRVNNSYSLTSRGMWSLCLGTSSTWPGQANVARSYGGLAVPQREPCLLRQQQVVIVELIAAFELG